MKRIIIKTAMAFVLLSGVSVGISPEKSWADLKGLDVKSFPAAMCQTNPDRKGYPVYGYNGEVYNGHPSESLDVICPLVRDTMASTTGVVHLYVSYIDEHPTRDPQCKLYYYNPAVPARIRIQRVDLTKDGSAPVLSYHRPPGRTVGKELTIYTVGCTLPPKSNGKASRLISIDYQEQD